jgi:hypothetical protein
MVKCFFANAFAMGTDVMRCFGSAGIVIGDSAIAARPAALPRDSNSDAAPTAGTNEVSKVGWIIATDSAATAVAWRRRTTFESR